MTSTAWFSSSDCQAEELIVTVSISHLQEGREVHLQTLTFNCSASNISLLYNSLYSSSQTSQMVTPTGRTSTSVGKLMFG